MLNKDQANRIKKLIEENERIVFFHHINPDGDCMASTFGFAKALMDVYPSKDIKVVADKIHYTPHLTYMDKYIDWDNTIVEPEHDGYLAIVGDVSEQRRVALFDKFKDSANKLIVFDHHENKLNFETEVSEFWSEPDYPASALMTYELLNEMNIEISVEASIVIAHGILTDTRRFMMSNGNENVYLHFNSLVRIMGENNHNDLIDSLMLRTEDDIKFESWVYSSYIKNDDLAYLVIDNECLDKFNYKSAQAAKVDLLMGIDGINYWVFFIQYDDHVRVEFRSNSEERRVDLFANQFNGGGHKQRAGCRLDAMSHHNDVIEYILKNK